MTPGRNSRKEFKNHLFSFLDGKIDSIMGDKAEKDEKLKAICKLLRDNVSYYNWVGFYLVDKERKDELVLGPFDGEPTEHTRIPFGKGVCGQAAQQKETFIVQDVSKETNYLSCSTRVISEIVVPIFKNGEIIGELDIDSHTVSPFTKEDEAFLAEISEKTSQIL